MPRVLLAGVSKTYKKRSGFPLRKLTSNLSYPLIIEELTMNNDLTNFSETPNDPENVQEPNVINGGDPGYSFTDSDSGDSREDHNKLFESIAAVFGKEITKALTPLKSKDEDKSGGMPIKMFGGKVDEDVDEWFIKFEIVAAAKDWSDNMKLKRLACYLEAHAFTAYMSASDEVKKSYEDLKKYMCIRFRPSNPFGHWRNQFRARKQALGETVISYAHGLQAIKKKLEMFDSSNAVSDVELKEVFLQGLHTYYRQRMIGMIGVDKFEDAVKVARGLEEGYRAVYPEVNEKLSRIGEPILDANCLLNTNPNAEAELLGMKPEQVRELLLRAQRDAQSKTLNDSFGIPNSGTVAVAQSSKNDRLSRIEDMLKNMRENNGIRRFGSGSQGRYPGKFQRISGSFNSRPRYGMRGGYAAAATNEGNFKRPVGDVKCFNCQKTGHWSKDCREKRNNEFKRNNNGKKEQSVNLMVENSLVMTPFNQRDRFSAELHAAKTLSRLDEFTLKTLSRNETAVMDEVQRTKRFTTLKCVGKLNDLGVEVMLDTGATTSLVKSSMVERIRQYSNLEWDYDELEPIRVANNMKIFPKGRVNLTVEIGDVAVEK